MMYKEISLLLKKIGIDLEKIKAKKDDVVDFNDLSLEPESSEKGVIYNDEETLENIYYKLMVINVILLDKRQYLKII